MSDRKPAGQSWESFAERKIREAAEQGAFDHLPGFGKPIDDLDQPLDENWWLRKKLREERLSVLPPILQVRLELERTLESICSAGSECEVRRRLAALNEKIRIAHFSPIAGPADGVCPVDVEAIVARWKEHRRASTERPA